MLAVRKKFIDEFGMPENKLNHLIHKHPPILNKSEEDIDHYFKVLKKNGMNTKEIIKVIE